MCGFFFCKGRRPLPERRRLERALAHMRRRGPDCEGLHAGDDWAIGHTRLSIIDLSPEANQPFWDASGRHVIAYNGEIYNFAELRRDLVRDGVALRTRSDTEVLLEAILHLGLERTLERVRGMFAFALYDTKTGRLVVVRDAFGQKPVYYQARGDEIAVASDPLALLELRGEAARPDPTAYSVYLSAAGATGTRGVFHADRSFFEGIQVLPAGHMLVCEGGPPKLVEYWNAWGLLDPEELARGAERSEEDLCAELRAHLVTAVERHLVSDVPVGVLLSGGIDSSLVYWLAQERRRDLTAFTKLSPGIEEIPLQVVPELLRRRPAEAHFSLTRPEDYLAGLAGFVAASRAPSRWGGGPPMAQLCRAARREGTWVLLGGDCADEVFAGYRHYEPLFADEAADPARPGELVSLDRQSPFYAAEHAAGFEEREREVRRRILERLAGVPAGRERRVAAELLHDTATFLQTCNLPHSDAYSMMESVELRNPLLDLDLVRFAVNLPERHKTRVHASGHFGKFLMRELAGREIGDFVNVQKEGTRNFSMKMAEPGHWRFEKFAIGDMIQVPEALERRDVIRLVNLEVFHRWFVLGDREIFPGIMTDAGFEACGRPLAPTSGEEAMR